MIAQPQQCSPSTPSGENSSRPRGNDRTGSKQSKKPNKHSELFNMATGRGKAG
jgi:hypothetical protein